MGGVLVGKDLIRASEIRATIAQIEKYNTAVHDFQLKYNSIPGDMMSSNAASVGFYYVVGATANTLAYGNGDGIIQGHDDPLWAVGGTFGGEVCMFFLHLSQAKMIEGMYGAGGQNSQIIGATPSGGSYGGFPKLSANASGSVVGEILPQAKLGNGNYFTVGTLNGKNYYVITGVTSLDTGSNVVSTNNISPVDAYSIDQKTDDGLPYKGSVYALDTETTPLSTSNGNGFSYGAGNDCVNSNIYYTSNSTYANSRLCSLRVAFQ